MKKKVVALSLVVAMVVMNSVVALGATVDTTWDGTTFTNGNEKEVKVRFTSAETEKYSVDITWGSMIFKYAQGTWNPSEHTYDSSTWSVDTGADNNITVENHSNKSVNVSMSANLNINQDGSSNSNYRLVGEFKAVSLPDNTTDISCSGNDITPSMGSTTLTRGLINQKNNPPSCIEELNINGDVQVDGHTADQEVSVGKITITLAQ